MHDILTDEEAIDKLYDNVRHYAKLASDRGDIVAKWKELGEYIYMTYEDGETELSCYQAEQLKILLEASKNV